MMVHMILSYPHWWHSMRMRIRLVAWFAAFVIDGGIEQQLERTICVTSYDYSLKLACKSYGPSV